MRVLKLILDDDIEDIELMQYHFENKVSNSKFFTASEEMLGDVREPCVVVTDYYLGKETGVDIVNKIILKHLLCYFIIVSSNTNRDMLFDIVEQDVRIKVIEKNADNFYEKLIEKIHEGERFLLNKIYKSEILSATIDKTLKLIEVGE